MYTQRLLGSMPREQAKLKKPRPGWLARCGGAEPSEDAVGSMPLERETYRHR